MKIEAVPCPVCDAPPGSLRLGETLQAKPIGRFSLAGVQTKVSARPAPVLTCDQCDLRLVGEYDGDGRHVTFPQPT